MKSTTKENKIGGAPLAALKSIEAAANPLNAGAILDSIPHDEPKSIPDQLAATDYDPTDDAGDPPPLPEPKTLGFDTIVFLCNKAEALAIMAMRPSVIPEGFEKSGGKRLCVEIQSGFDKSICKGARIVTFSAPCNIAEAAVECIEVPIHLGAFKRRDLWNNTKDKSLVQAEIEDALEAAKGIPLKAYTCKMIPLLGAPEGEVATIEEF